MSMPLFLRQFLEPLDGATVPAKHLFSGKRQMNSKLDEMHRLALTMRGVIDRSVDDTDGLQTSDFSTYQKFAAGDLAFKLIDLQNLRTSRVGLVPRHGIMSPAYIRIAPRYEQVSSQFYYWFFYGAYLNNVFNGLGGGIRQNLGVDDLLSIPVPDWSLDRQLQAAAYLDIETARIDTLIEEKTQLIALLREKRVAVISHAVTKGLDPSVPMKPSGQDWLGDVPAHWKVAPLGSLGRSANGVSASGDMFGEGDPFLTYSDVYNNRCIPASLSGLMKSTPDDHRRYSIEPGDIFFTRTSETADEIAFASVAMSKVEKATFAGFLIRFRPYVEVLDPEFSKFAFQTSGQRYFFAREMKVVTRASLSQGVLHRLPVPLPPLQEQREIGDRLSKLDDTFDALVTETERSIALLREKRAALITAAVTGQIDIPEAA